ncbi:winged helix-turn-helix transcriptional regulator [Symbiopectobacterium purcellii]|uniref:winged helix-turn-helix transcriptional regulator n=1 Tax=Symbiopectobacterium purcellii TaxID=2871826 RepID=UPI003F834C2F
MRYREFVLSPYGVIKIKSLGYIAQAIKGHSLVIRTVYPVVPPKVEYQLTDLGLSLGAAFCGVWVWAEENLATIRHARAIFDQRKKGE